MSTNQDPQHIVATLRQSPPPQSIEDVRDRLNLVQGLIGSITPGSAFDEAMLEALFEINQSLAQLTGGVADKPGTSILELPTETIPLLQEANIRLEEIVRGTVSTQGLPVGLTGTATVDIANGETGVGLFDFSGGRYAALVTADERIDQFDNIRVKESEANLVTPISTEQEIGDLDAPQNRRQEYDVSVNADANILDDSVRPRTAGSSFRVNVTLDTTTDFAVRVIPDDDDVADFTTRLNEHGQLEAGANFEFTRDVDPNARYNFRTPDDAVTVTELRVQELLVSQ